MSEMIVRLARALHREDAIMPSDYGDSAWEDDSKSQRERCLRLTRTVLAAMREPTSEMCNAYGTDLQESYDCWTKMIDKALE
jgi:hypothetical protein